MKDAEGNLVLGRTRWRRFALALLPTTVAVGAIMVGIANGVIGAGFTVSGEQFKVSADHLHGDVFKQYGDFDRSKANPAIPVARSTIDDATLNNLCQSVNVKNPLGVKIVLRIEAGKDAANPVTAKNLSLGMTQLSGDATFHNIQIGNDGGDLSGDAARNGSFGQRADSVDIDNLQQVAYDTSAGTFTLKGLSLRVLVGAAANECF
ncbi:MAG TPA: DUF6230 family protein [Micromonosporaceae bacterium]